MLKKTATKICRGPVYTSKSVTIIQFNDIELFKVNMINTNRIVHIQKAWTLPEQVTF